MKVTAVLLVLVAMLDSVGSGSTARVADEPQSQADTDAPNMVEVPPASEEALGFYRSGMTAWGIRVVLGFLIPATILVTGFSAQLRNLSRRVSRDIRLATRKQRARGVSYDLSAGVYAGLYLTITALCLLPLEWYQFFLRYHGYGLSNQTFLQWFRDALITFSLGLGAVILIVPGVYFFLRASPRRWWLYTTIGAILTITALRIALPVWIAPLYDDFGRMRDTTLEREIITLAQRAGVEGGRVYEVNKSEDTELVNAYVTGGWNTKRIVLWDTLVDKLNREQVLFVMGHEMGHYVLNHAWKTTVLAATLILISLYTVHRTARGLITRFSGRFGFDSLSDVASVPLILLIVSVLSIVATPVSLAYSRHVEHESDRFSLELTRNNYAAATTWIALQRENLSNPNPGWIYRTWRATHPALADRVVFANQYRPWETGDELTYGKEFEGLSH